MTVATVVGLLVLLLIVRAADLRNLARLNCEASNENRMALALIMDASVEVRRELGDPDAEAFAARYAKIKRDLLEPRDCE